MGHERFQKDKAFSLNPGDELKVQAKIQSLSFVDHRNSSQVMWSIKFQRDYSRVREASSSKTNSSSTKT